jgi:hypothetical protein
MATAHPSVRLPVPCPDCGREISVRITVLESAVRDGEETHTWAIDPTAAREHAEHHHGG